jgi:glycosyltransferase involved in cell wall biosynthesis
MTTTQESENKLLAKFAVVIPVYKNEASLPELFEHLGKVAAQLDGRLRVVFVDDCSPDNSATLILSRKLISEFEIELVRHSRNFGSFTAIRTGLKFAKADYVGVISADLQESPSLLIEFFLKLQEGSTDIVFGRRKSRQDPIVSKLFSSLYWKIYRKFINRDIPVGGVDLFACTREVVKIVNSLTEGRTSLIGMLFWVGFRRSFVDYSRNSRRFGKSSWSFRKKFEYMSDSIFSFSDLPIRFIRLIGVIGTFFAVLMSGILLFLSWTNSIDVPGYAPLMLAIILGNSANLLALGVLGSYIWRSFELAQSRPLAILRVNAENEFS